eukprot:TRINITY_DN7429_c0_g1_i4.p1 TRINITY_DN7429_c0_g1~~TRINITY_DN7429_c0_g1_i4.p1  ORF type:complete len:483 (+),score=41.37 TRINITY_DN7429_c0_g1_i4:186-1634(+)
METTHFEDNEEVNNILKKRPFNWKRETCQLFVDSFASLISLIAGTTIADANLYFIGRLGRFEYTAAAGVATTLFNSLAYAPTVCMSYGLGNIGSQLAGADKLSELGLMFHSSIIFNVFLGILGYGLLIGASKLLIFTGIGIFTIDQITSYVSFLLLAILSVGLSTPLRQVLVSQQYFSFQTKINFPLCVLHVFWSWLFTFPLELGFIGSPLAIALTETLIAFFTFGYVWCYHPNSKVWIPWSRKSFTNIPRYLKKVIPMALTMYAEWIAFEAMTFICSFLGEFQMAVFTTYVNVLVTFYMIPLALSITFGTKIGNAMGAFEPQEAKNHIKTGLLAVVMSIIVTASFTSLCSHQIARFFSEDPNVIKSFEDTSIYISLFLLADGISCALSNILRTVGAETFALKGYIFTYSSGIIFGSLLVFTFKVIPNGIGLIIGLLCGTVCFVISGFCKLYSLDFEHQCSEVKNNLAASLVRSLVSSHVQV